MEWYSGSDFGFQVSDVGVRYLSLVDRDERARERHGKPVSPLPTVPLLQKISVS